MPCRLKARPQEKAKSASNKLTKVQVKKEETFISFHQIEPKFKRNILTNKLTCKHYTIGKKTIKKFISFLPNKFFKREVFERGDSKKIIILFWADVVY